MRVWLVPSRFAPHLGGIETVVAELALELQRAGDEVLVLTHQHPETLPREELLGSVRIRRMRFESPSRRLTATATFLRSMPIVTRLLASEAQPDVIHVHGAANQLFPVARYARARGIPLVMTTHGELTGDSNRIHQRSRYMRASLRYGVRHAAAITAPSEGPLEDLRRLTGGTRAQEHVVPNGIRIFDWHSDVPVSASRIVLAWGRLEAQKGFDRLLAAWPYVKAAVPDAQLLIAGDGSERPRLEAMLTPNASLLGPLDRSSLAIRLREAQISAVPSRMEAFGMSALESLAAGRPVIHSGLPALTDLVGESGWVAPHDDPRALARGICDALLESPRTVPMSLTARYDWSAVIHLYRKVYSSVLSS